MKSVLQSVFSQLNKMIAALLLFVIVAYWYSIWAFMNENVRNQYAFEDRMNCNTLLDCFRVHIDYGFASPPIWGEGNELTPIPMPYEIFNFVYVLFINLIITAIISGIIIDTFADMRGQQEEISQDDMNNCFICNIEREKFERVGIDFNKHRNQDHPMNQYIWLKYYL